MAQNFGRRDGIFGRPFGDIRRPRRCSGRPVFPSRQNDLDFEIVHRFSRRYAFYGFFGERFRVFFSITESLLTLLVRWISR
jgi:hypothetical protein